MRGAVAALALMLAATPTAAQPSDVFKAKRAADLYELGKRHFDIADYSGAIASWKESYLLSSASLLLFNIAQAYRLGGNCAEANRFYLSYKRIEPRPSNQVELDKAMEKCAGVEPATGESVLEAPPAALPPQATASQPRGAPASPSRDEADPGASWKLAGYATAGAGGIALVAAVVFAISASNKAGEIADRPTGTTWDPTLAATQDDGRAAATRARVFAGLGVVALAAGGALWWIGNGRARVGVAASAQHAQIGLSCAF